MRFYYVAYFRRVLHIRKRKCMVNTWRKFVTEFPSWKPLFWIYITKWSQQNDVQEKYNIFREDSESNIVRIKEIQNDKFLAYLYIICFKFYDVLLFWYRLFHYGSSLKFIFECKKIKFRLPSQRKHVKIFE